MITLTQFGEALDYIKKFQNAAELLNKGFEMLGQDSTVMIIEPEVGIVKLLEAIFNDKYKWIDYFLYDLDWGKKWTEDSITDTDGSSIRLSTVEELYEFLVKEMK